MTDQLLSATTQFLINRVTSPVTTEPRRLSARQRCLLGVTGIVGLTLLVMARCLEPDPRGYGTHEQLGLTPCYFHELTGHVCPMCGGTTAWAHVLRGELPQAARANLGATLLCVAVVISWPWFLLTTIVGRWWIARPKMPILLVFASAWLAVVVMDWLRKIYLDL